MKIFDNKHFLFNEQGDRQDTIFLVGILLLLSILIIGLLPGQSTDSLVTQEFLISSVMVVPVIAAIYFIILSFRRNLYADSSMIGSNIRKKILLAFVFVAVLPSLPIVFASNYIIQQTMSRLSFSETSRALEAARDMAYEIESLEHVYDKKLLSPSTFEGRNAVTDFLRIRNFTTVFGRVNDRGRIRPVAEMSMNSLTDEMRIIKLYNSLDLSLSNKVNRVSVDDRSYYTAFTQKGNIVTILMRDIPLSVDRNLQLFDTSYQNFSKVRYLGQNIQSNTSVFLLSLSIFLIIISVVVSHYLSTTITRPVLELSEAANEIASGNFAIQLKRDSDDEMGILYRSFNHMIEDLNRNRKIMYQKQRLEAWKDMARKVVHEIKNPLTPIRLSAERMRKHCMEDSPHVKNTIMAGTETIIEEVVSLMNLLSEFTNFARLPEMKPRKEDIGAVVESSAGLFEGHEHVTIKIYVENNLPEIYIDKNLIKRALGNIIQNAIDALQENGQIVINVTGLKQDDSDMVRIVIADNGMGIQEKDLERIFEPGFSGKPAGTGLGLAIVEKIILEHQGNISCKSEYGKGAEFIIELPVIHEGVLFNGQDINS